LSNCNLGLWLFLGIASSSVFEEAISQIIFYVKVLMKLNTSSLAAAVSCACLFDNCSYSF